MYSCLSNGNRYKYLTLDNYEIILLALYRGKEFPLQQIALDNSCKMGF